jgi:hypothetical protein
MENSNIIPFYTLIARKLQEEGICKRNTSARDTFPPMRMDGKARKFQVLFTNKVREARIGFVLFDKFGEW